ncbi:MAG: type I polyketide synthase, partial [Acidobacteria bacterium]|nr:type I polyketide synthase [Acidobacteriota bacterium]
ANDVNELWENLANGRDCIGEVPADRWDWRTVYGDLADDNKTNIKWGGFMDGVYDFDPQFFNISPREATLMDPQQRLLMMYVWKAIEDAGYSPSQLSGSNTAIFFATGVSDYGRVIARSATNIDAYVSTGNVASVGPNRMSYYLDLHGPSDPIETACSSSLVAIHRAVAAMRSGECEMAIVGGVNTILTPDLHISFTKAGMLSEDGRCKTFSANANGYVRSEGVAALLLKPLSAAEAAGDHIYGVILGSAENHGGRANTLTSPNPQAQAALLKRAYKEAGVDPSTVSYIEAHGTGTALGDPIEVEGLKAAFSDAEGHCGLGSVKSNIGHLELAAGIAGVIKVLLQMKHRTLAPTLHCESINPYIHLEGSPFYVVQEKAEWGGDAPRRAGVSSFGFGGSNAHIVLQEYVGNRTTTATTARQAILLSARTPERLREQAEQLLAANIADADLADIAYTLQVGREAMDERLAFIVGSTAELAEQLHAFLNGEKPAHRGRAQKRDELLSTLAADEAFQTAVAKWIEQGRLEMLLDLWIKGLDLDWHKLHAGAARKRVSLPTYPFARERFAIETSFGQAMARAAASAPAVLHPLLHANTSDLHEQRYSTQIDGEFSPAAHLEMARAAIERAFPAADASMALELKDVVWGEQNAPNAALVHIALAPGTADDVEYEIYTQDVVLSQGRGTWAPSDRPASAQASADYVLHPAAIDRVGSLAALASLRILAPCTPDMTVRRHSSASVDLCDEAGNVCVQMRGITLWQTTEVIEAPMAPARREIAVQMPAERKKPSAIALAMPGVAMPATAAGRMPISLSQMAEPSPVRLFDDGDGIFTLEIESAAGLRQALEKAQEEPSL